MPLRAGARTDVQLVKSRAARRISSRALCGGVADRVGQSLDGGGACVVVVPAVTQTDHDQRAGGGTAGGERHGRADPVARVAHRGELPVGQLFGGAHAKSPAGATRTSSYIRAGGSTGAKARLEHALDRSRTRSSLRSVMTRPQHFVRRRQCLARAA